MVWLSGRTEMRESGPAPTWTTASRVTLIRWRHASDRSMPEPLHTNRERKGRGEDLTSLRGRSTSSDEPPPPPLLVAIYSASAHVTHRWPEGGSQPVPAIMGPAPLLLPPLVACCSDGESHCEHRVSAVITHHHREHPWPEVPSPLTPLEDGGLNGVLLGERVASSSFFLFLNQDISH